MYKRVIYHLQKYKIAMSKAPNDDYKISLYFPVFAALISVLYRLPKLCMAVSMH